jgi:branched-chain amino acid transport system permease protein
MSAAPSPEPAPVPEDAEPERVGRLTGGDLRLLGCCLGGSILLAVMSGPPGSNATPTAGITGSLHPARALGFLGFGLVLWVCMTLTKKTRSGELPAVSDWGRTLAGSWGSQWDGMLKRTPARRALELASGVVLFVLSLLVADFTGPYVANKLSYDELRHQLVFGYTYGYLMFALVLCVLAWRRVLERHGVREARASTRGLRRTTLVVLGCLVASLVFALASNPWLPAQFHWSYLALRAHGTTIFWQWPTVMYLLGSLVVARQILRRSTKQPRTSSVRARRRFATPEISLVTVLFALFVAVEWPKFLSGGWQGNITIQIGVYALLALGLNVVVGFAGLLDLGYVAFYAIGAYTAAYFAGALPIHAPHVLNLFFICPIAIAAAMLGGALLGLPTLRLHGDYLAIVTLGLGEIIAVAAENWTQVTNGAQGTNLVPEFSINFLGIHYTWNVANELPNYYLLLGFVAVAIFIFHSLNKSRVGRRWAAIREDEVAAQASGINPLKYKVMAFAIGASTAGFAGVFTAANQTYLFPSSYVLQVSILVLALVIFGGAGSIPGVIAGAAFLNWAMLYLQLHPYFGYQQEDFFMYLGVIFILFMIFRPQGILPTRRSAHEFELGLGFDEAVTQQELAANATFDDRGASHFGDAERA